MTDRADPAAPAERLAAHFLAAAEMPTGRGNSSMLRRAKPPVAHTQGFFSRSAQSAAGGT